MRVCTSCQSLLEADARQCPADGAAADAVDTLPRGTRLGAYRIERVLGEGGMGFVYEATHEVLQRRSAIKLLRPELAGQPHIVTRFLNEARAVNLIDHQNIVNVYDYGDRLRGCVYFVMEFLEGETLDELMRRRRPMAVPLLLHVFGQIARALGAAHAKQIVHRDLKPANVFVIAREGNPYFVKLLDFGIAQLRGAGAAQGLTLAGSVMGTPQYMSPEQISGGAVDARSDLWALGVMLYRAATGHAPFRGEQFAELADRILHHPPPPAGELVALPAALSQLIASCLERRIEARCQSIGELLAGLDRVKRECGLDDDAVLAAVLADTGAAGALTPAGHRDPTRGSLAGSVPRYQGAEARGPAAAAAPRSRFAMYATGAAAAAVIGAVGFAVVGRGERARPAAASGPDAAGEPAVRTTPGSPGDPPGSQPGTRSPTQPATQPGIQPGTQPGTQSPTGTLPGQRSIRDAFAAGDAAAVRALAERDLRDAIAGGTLQQQGFAVDALGDARSPAGAPLLYAALAGPLEVRVKAARALGELALPDAAVKLRAAIAESGERIKVELAAVAFRLGDRDARAMLGRALGDPAMRLTAATALAAGADPAGREVLADVVAATPPGREPWRRAAGGLIALGDPAARKLLQAELAQPDALRAVPAAELLARAGDAAAREQLARAAADPGFARPGDAALALARLGDPRGLDWVARGLASSDADERRAAIAICGALGARAAAHRGAIAGLATADPDARVRLTAEAVLLGLQEVR